MTKTETDEPDTISISTVIWIFLLIIIICKVLYL